MQKIGNYELLEELGFGGYGKVYKARHLTSNQLFAMKTSPISDRSVGKEAKILKHLKACEAENGIPKYFEYGKTSEYNFLVMELLGKTLQTEQIILDGTFSMGCIIAIGQQLIDRIEYIHSKSVIHRDIKPQQLLLSEDGTRICLCDFGLGTKYLLKKKHKPFKSNSRTKGSVSFASVNTHMGFKLSRRDDLESLFYTLACLRLGRLPWQDSFRGLEGVRKWNVCLTSKMFHIGRLFSSFPTEFSHMFQYIRLLKYDQKPDYSYLKKGFEKVVAKLKITPMFNWDCIYTKPRKLSTADTIASMSCSKKVDYSTNSAKKGARNSIKIRRKKSEGIFDNCQPRRSEILDTEICGLPEIKYYENKSSLRRFRSCIGLDIQNSKVFEGSNHTDEGILPEITNRVIFKV
ncbi:hypothetical protein SteCoe_23561 [Stentor coeruleus]|uniref:Casein kinase I n=1 Tax=Stentor coeruleus TaxID=5963 RepID=A0A1R2BJI4_9CILI|nr:hypothetical protein SteCoe_23561 [Stentor coeruleus]